MIRPTFALAVGLAFAALPAAARAVVNIDTFTTTGGEVAYPLTDTIRQVSQPSVDVTGGIFGTARLVSIGALPPTPLPSDLATLDDDLATLALDTAAGTLTASATAEVGFAAGLIYTGQIVSPPDVDVSGEDRVRIAYTATGDVTLQLTLTNFDTSNRTTNGSRSPVLTLPAGSGVFDVAFADLTQVVRVPFGGSIVDLPPVDLASLDTIGFDFRSVGEGGSLTLSNLAVVPEPATLGLAGVAGLCLLRRRRA